MQTVLTLTIKSTDGDLLPETVASAERAFGASFTVSGNTATGELTLPDGVTVDELVEHLRGLPGVEITRDEIIDSSQEESL